MTHTIIYKVRDVAAYVNWLYFFHAWHFPSSYAAISRVHGCVACRTNWQQRFPDEERPRVAEAMKLYDEAQRLLAEWDAAGIEVRFRVCLEAANSEGDDIFLLESGLRLPMLRQQVAHDGVCLCLADFVRPKSKGGAEDRVGVFASTVESRAERWDEDDEFRRMLSQTLADRLAEAAAEAGHQQVRRRLWGYAPDENLQPDELFREQYVGRRPAVGYPSLPRSAFRSPKPEPCGHMPAPAASCWRILPADTLLWDTSARTNCAITHSGEARAWSVCAHF